MTTPSPLSDPEVRAQLEGGIRRLAHEFTGIFSPETITRFVFESGESLAQSARIMTFLPLFAYRFARERLKALGQAEGSIVKEVPEVLFVCVQNAGRSQMAAALLHHHAQGQVHVRSAGSAPAGEIHRNVADSLAEIGLDIEQEFPKPLTDEVVRAADVVITMGCGDACPIYPGKRYLDWDVPDPAGKSVQEVGEIRDDIDRRVRALLAELAHAAS
jgi:arsenate reductase